MANARQLTRRITTAKNISQITKAMEMVAASKMQRSQEQALASRAYTRAIQNSLKIIAQNTDQSLHPLLSTHEEGSDVMVLISTDKGLVGGLNTNLYKAAFSWKKSVANPKVIAVGRRAVHFCRLAKLEIIAQFTDLPDMAKPEDTLPIAQLAMTSFLSKEYKSVTIIYTDFINTLKQEVRKWQLLPVAADEYESESMLSPEPTKEYLFEPNAKELLNQLLPYYIENTLFQILLEAKASEHSARMVAMKNASENAGELVSELKLVFNKTRQAAITTELLDITTATLSISG